MHWSQSGMRFRELHWADKYAATQSWSRDSVYSNAKTQKYTKVWLLTMFRVQRNSQPSCSNQIVDKTSVYEVTFRCEKYCEVMEMLCL